MNGYIVVSANEETGEPKGFWNGIVFEDAIEKAQFFSDKLAARGAVGSLQTRNVDQDIKLILVRLTITLGHDLSPEGSTNTES